VAQATSLIAQSLVDRYAAGPSATRRSAVKALHEDLRKALEDAEPQRFDTFLQGSYRNGTAIADINDVDIVALYDPWRSPATDAEWNKLFSRIAAILRNSSRVTGSVKINDKCVTLSGTLKADIVPAISRTTYSSTDPVLIYSRRDREERPNYPRTHYDNGVAKQADTNDRYKPTVRLFKRWARQYPSLTAPSFYIECAVHSVADSRFADYLPLSFAAVASELVRYPRHKVIYSVAGDKDILVTSEWHPDDFEAFQKKLRTDAQLVVNAMKATTSAEANRLWKLAFGD
jgi:Nucleotidyltransferase domain